MRQLGNVDATIGPYAGNVTAVRRAWLRDHRPVAAAYVRATRAGLAWVFDPANRAAAAQLLAAQVGMRPADAPAMLDRMVAPGGLSRTGAIDVAGVRTVLALRARYATPAVPLGAPTDYFAGTP